jgi:hypothetical protein
MAAKKIEPTNPDDTKANDSMGEHDAKRVTGRRASRKAGRKAYKKSV